ncbi:hypothetical protein S245_010253, partial [Arachis hypogaea]
NRNPIGTSEGVGFSRKNSKPPSSKLYRTIFEVDATAIRRVFPQIYNGCNSAP